MGGGYMPVIMILQRCWRRLFRPGEQNSVALVGSAEGNRHVLNQDIIEAARRSLPDSHLYA